MLRQPGGIAWDVFDARIAAVARQFEDFREAESAGAIMSADTIADLARAMHVPALPWRPSGTKSKPSRRAGERSLWPPVCPRATLGPPFRAVKVTGALFHTQGGLAIDAPAA